MTKILLVLDKLFTRLGERWVIVKDGWAAIRPTWIAALIATVVAVALQNAQALDALKEILLDPAGGRARFMLFLSVALAAFAAWYFPRALLYVSYPRYTPPNPARHERLRTWGPRVLGLLPLLSLALAHAKVGAPWYAALYLLTAVVFLVFLIRRRRGRPAPPLRTSLPRPTFWVAVSIQVLSVICLAIFLVSKVGFPQLFGPLGILLLAAAMWISFGSMLMIYPTYRYSTPSGLFLLVILAGLFSLWNDNHQVRERPLAERRVAAGEWREPFGAHLASWKRARGITDAGQGYPLFVVAAEGGGIRAAYWTAAVLAQLEDRNPGFACHLFAVSGVSGGSLGGAVFASLVARLVDDGELRCGDRPTTTARSPAKEPGDYPPDKDSGPLTRRAHRILNGDFLAPTLAGMLFPDVVQRFWPFSKRLVGGWLAFPDRATYLEEAWEEADPRFAERFRRLWQGERRYLVPSLFLNGTWVENGGRVVTTNLRFDAVETAQAPAGRGPASASGGFVRLDDMIGCLGRSINLSTAVHMSARFTYVSPAGTVRVADPSRCPSAETGAGSDLHVVDGGYFENSGAHTAAEIVERLRQEGWRGPIHTLIVSNNPENPNAEPDEGGEDPDGEAEGRRVPFGETLSPAFALLNTRSARGFYSESYLAGIENSLRFQLLAEATTTGRRGREPEEATFPLGWTLSPDTELRMVRQAAVNRNLVEVCRLLPAATRDCRQVARQIVESCRRLYAEESPICRRLEQKLGDG